MIVGEAHRKHPAQSSSGESPGLIIFPVKTVLLRDPKWWINFKAHSSISRSCPVNSKNIISTRHFDINTQIGRFSLLLAAKDAMGRTGSLLSGTDLSNCITGRCFCRNGSICSHSASIRKRRKMPCTSIRYPTTGISTPR